MRYSISHRTTYTYPTPVYESFNEVRLQPLVCATQAVLDFDLHIEPPATVIAFRDYYGNPVHNFGVAYLHDRLLIEATSDVVTYAAANEPLIPVERDPDPSPRLADLAGDQGLQDELAEFLGASTFIALDPRSEEIACCVVAADSHQTALSFLDAAMSRIRCQLEYRIGTTNVHSSVAEVLDVGSGVCQDFAHVLISLCRHVGLPARYVSGYLGGEPPARASHAWVEAYVPPYGWLGIDATHDTYCTGRHVKVSVGRDYADVAVLRGTYKGASAALLDVEVESIERAGFEQPSRPEVGAGTEPNGRVMAIQNLGAMRRYQRGAVLMQAMGGSRDVLADDLPPPPPRVQTRTHEEAPSQQPHQQQQPGRTETSLTLAVGCQFDYTAESELPATVLVEPHSSLAGMVVDASWDAEITERYEDLYGNVCVRVRVPAGSSSLVFGATVTVSPDAEAMPARETPLSRIEDVPAPFLHWLLPSRLCESDLLAERAWQLFGTTPPTAERVYAVVSWIHESFEYGVPSVPTTTAAATLDCGGGVCRDFAHLGVTFCRALGIPARYVFGYMPDIGIPGPYPLMDFHAWFEVWLAGIWWTFDARFATARIGRVPIGRGRDAVDVAMVTTYGPATLERMSVRAELVGSLQGVLAPGATGRDG